MDQLSEADQRTNAALERGVPPLFFQDMVVLLHSEAFNIMIERQKKYGPENIKSMGEAGVIVRLNDKMERLKKWRESDELIRAVNTLHERGILITEDLRKELVDSIERDSEVSDESVDDTLHDIMNYALILLALRRGWWAPPLR